jgi:poly(A) polymerase/tRNA nucleotidyltransferase (CCA-adding enzyme)
LGSFGIICHKRAIAASLDSAGKFEIVDPYGGSLDLKKKIIRTVGNPIDRFQEDALRLLRSARFSVQLDFSIDPTTASAVREKSELLGAIAAERIRDEISKILLTSKAAEGIYLLEELQLLRYIFPELREGISCGQNKHHIYSVFEHNVRALAYTVQQQYSLTVRLAALLHDVGKPRVKRGDGPDSTFYNHDIVGGKMARAMLERLHFPKEVIRDVSHLVRHHLFYYNVGEVTEAGVRRFLARVGLEYIDDLLKVREADRIGSGVPKAVPYKTRHLQFMIDKVRHDPLSPKMLKIDGLRIMELTGTTPSPKVGFLLHILLEEVIGDPKKNEAEYLESRVMALSALGSAELEAMSVKAKEVQQEFESGEEAEMKKKYYVQ